MMRRLHRLSRGSWQPARLIEADVILAAYAAIVQGLFRAWDYSTGKESGGVGSPALSLVESTGPLWLWSGAFYAGSALLLIGVLQRRHMIVWLGHFSLFGCYAVLGLGLVLPALTNPWLDGVRSATVLILPCTIHWLFARRTGPKPAKHHTVTETIGGPA